MIGSFLFLPCIVWEALSPSYNCYAAARVVTGIVSAFSQTLPPASIADIFAPAVRGSKMSIFTVAVVVAPVVAPIVCSAVIVRGHPWPVLFWITLGLAFLQLALFFFVVPETLWTPTFSPVARLESQEDQEESSKELSAAQTQDYTLDQSVTEGKVGPAWMPWSRPKAFLSLITAPILMVRYLSVTLTSIYYGMLFAWSVGITIVMPQLYEKDPTTLARSLLAVLSLPLVSVPF